MIFTSLPQYYVPGLKLDGKKRLMLADDNPEISEILPKFPVNIWWRLKPWPILGIDF